MGRASAFGIGDWKGRGYAWRRVGILHKRIPFRNHQGRLPPAFAQARSATCRFLLFHRFRRRSMTSAWIYGISGKTNVSPVDSALELSCTRDFLRSRAVIGPGECGRPSHSQSMEIESRVMPASWVPSSRRSEIAFIGWISVDLPRFRGGPTMARLDRLVGAYPSGSTSTSGFSMASHQGRHRQKCLVVDIDMRQLVENVLAAKMRIVRSASSSAFSKAFLASAWRMARNRSAMPSPCSADRPHRFAKSPAPSLVQAAGPALPSSLVRRSTTECSPLRNSGKNSGPQLVDADTRIIRNNRDSASASPFGSGLPRMRRLQAAIVDVFINPPYRSGSKAARRGDPSGLVAVTRYARLVIDQRHFLAGERLETASTFRRFGRPRIG